MTGRVAIEQAVILSPGPVLVLDDGGWRVRAAGNAAAQLGLSASTLHSRMKKLGIRRPSVRPRRG